MTPFLDAIALHYHRAHELALNRFAFVFPNLRSRDYFKAKITSLASEGTLALSDQSFVTMAEFMEKSAGLRRGEPLELVVLLYVAYCNVRLRLTPDRAPEDFDRFRYWGEMMLKDFDQIDRWLADRKGLFKNVRDFKSLQSTYLTPEQLEIIRQFWGDDPYWGNLDTAHASDGGEQEFWRHLAGPEGPEGRFSMLWNMLGEIYDEFQRLLRDSRKSYSGMAYRRTATKLKNGDFTGVNTALTYVFIGFSELSTAELTVMDTMRRRSMAEIFWDYCPELMGPDNCEPAGRNVRAYMKRLPQTVELTDVYPPLHHVRIVGVPSNVGQVRVAVEELEADTAIVLQSDDLLLPLLSAIPEKYDRVSVSLGYPVKFSEIATLFSTVVSLQMRLIKRADGSMEFFRDDVMEILSHPLIVAAHAADRQAIIDYLADNYLFNLPANGAPLGALESIFTPLEADAATDAALDYLESLLLFMTETLKGLQNRELDATLAEYLANQAKTLRRLIERYPQLTMKRHTLFRMVESAIFRRPVPLQGSEFGGIQLLSMSETRLQSFDRLIMLSMSDRVFPGKRVASSFIPVSLRHAFGLPTPSMAEATSAYQFYRLLSHAEEATYIFDARSGGLRSGDMSRFLYQIRYLPFESLNVEFEMAGFAPVTIEKPKTAGTTGVRKTPEIMAVVNEYRDPSKLAKRAFSASALKKYINCPLSFYLQYIAGWRLDDSNDGDVGSAEIGLIFHSVSEIMYCGLRDKGCNPISRETLAATVGSPELREAVVRSINLHMRHMPEKIESEPGSGVMVDNPDLLRPLRYEDLAFADFIEEMWKMMVEHEPDNFTFIDAEYGRGRHFPWRYLPTEPPVNFTMSIDRIDSVEEGSGRVIRMIDYKTGQDQTRFTDVASLLNFTQESHLGGIFQTMLYCAAWSDITGDRATPLRPLIYKVTKLGQDQGIKSIEQGFVDTTGNKKKTTYKPFADFRTIEQDFRRELANKINEIFDESVDFRRRENPSEKACAFCDFKRFCGLE